MGDDRPPTRPVFQGEQSPQCNKGQPKLDSGIEAQGWGASRSSQAASGSASHSSTPGSSRVWQPRGEHRRDSSTASPTPSRHARATGPCVDPKT